MPTATYLIALGSNRPKSARLTPIAMVRAGFAALDEAPCRLLRASRVIETSPIGPARRRFANAAALIGTELDPPALLCHLKRLEQSLGRRRGRRWGDRAIDLDIIGWSGGRWRSRTLTIPHAQAHCRDFVLYPATAIAPDWRHGGQTATLRQLLAQIKRPKPVDRSRSRH